MAQPAGQGGPLAVPAPASPLVPAVDIPLDVWEAVRKHLPKAHWGKARAVCKEWRGLFSAKLEVATATNETIRGVNAAHQAQRKWDGAACVAAWVRELGHVSTSFPRIRRLDLTALPLDRVESFLALSPVALRQALPHFGALRTLCLSIGLYDADAAGVVRDLQDCTVGLPRVEVEMQLLDLGPGPSGACLSTTPVLHEAMMAALASLPTLTGLTASYGAMKYATAPAAVRARYVADIAALVSLRSLRLHGVPFADLHPWASLTRLTSLSLHAAMARDEAFAFLPLLCDLQEVELWSSRMTPHIISTLVQLSGLTRLALHVDGRTHISHTLTDECLRGLSRLPRLADLALNREGLRGDFMTALGPRLPLTRLALLANHDYHTLAPDSFLIDQGLAAIATAPGLQELRVPGCNFIREGGVHHLTSLTNLTCLHFSGSSLETKVDVFARLRRLRVLELDWVSWRAAPLVRTAVRSGVRPVHVGALLRRLTTLTELEVLRLRTLPNPGGVDDQHELSRALAKNLDTLAEAMPALTSVYVYDLEAGRFQHLRVRRTPGLTGSAGKPVDAPLGAV